MNSDTLPFTTKETFEGLLPTLEFSEADKLQIEKAVELAIHAHQNQKRDSGTPYLEEHIWNMGMKIIERYRGTAQLKEILICGLLHDAVEDSIVVSIDQIKEHFGHEIAEAIKLLSKNEKENKESLSESEKYEINKNYVSRMSENKLASIVKIEDRLSNLSCIVTSTIGNNLPKYKRYVTETADIFLPLGKKYEDLGYVELLKNEIDRIKLLITSMPKIYITAHFAGTENKAEIEQLCSLIKEAGYQDFCFIRDVEHYEKMFFDSRLLMQRAMEELNQCDALFLDFDGPGTGRIVELGMAYALKKKIIIATKKGTVVRDTIRGVADLFIEYGDISEIVAPMRQYVTKM